MKIKFGAIVTDGRGKIGGHVASKNRAGAYLRTKVTPTNPQTVAQSEARALLGSLAQNWSGLTDAQRLAWNNAVSDWGSTDIFGDVKNPTGLNLYVKLNSNLAGINQAFITSPPAKMNTPTAIVESATYDVSSGDLTLQMSDGTGDGENLLIRATTSLSAGVSYVKSSLRVIGNGTSVAGVVTLTGNYADKFGVPAVGANVFVSAQFVMTNGQKTPEQKIKVTVVA